MLYFFLTRDLLEIHCIVRRAVKRMREQLSEHKANILALCEFCGACAIKTASRNAVEFLRDRKQRRKNIIHFFLRPYSYTVSKGMRFATPLYNKKGEQEHVKGIGEEL